MEDWVYCLSLFCAVFSARVLGFPDGKISPACDSMLPSHGNFVSQTTSAPYRISISSTSFDPGNKITVTLQGIDNSTFKGFLLQARAVSGDGIVGTFQIIDPNTQGLLCNQVQNSSVSHTDRNSKKNVTAIWVAPSGTGNVQFRATVVQNVSVFWTNVRSQTLVSSSSSVDSHVLGNSEGRGLHLTIDMWTGVQATDYVSRSSSSTGNSHQKKAAVFDGNMSQPLIESTMASFISDNRDAEAAITYFKNHLGSMVAEVIACGSPKHRPQHHPHQEAPTLFTAGS
ncbi:putative ferric-chelate reductase 1 [Trachemys scripta elegans]|uniref:putative ferric-chelate reductase 1 n=1 Tax=Trachemys scripta elegans TaxID=31138 RepID=UPI0015558A12|nr:putative ferric-chelate reductase 1 [Trachemys scripta elegans]